MATQVGRERPRADIAWNLRSPETRPIVIGTQPQSEGRQMARETYSMYRRSFCGALASVLVAPGIAIAQASKVVRRIGFLDSGPPDPPEWIWKEAEPLRE